MKVITTEKIPIKVWGELSDDATLEQAKQMANLPFAQKWVVVLPGNQLGYGVPIDSVLVTDPNIVVVSAIGNDIGCLDKDTEFLTSKGWKYISEYDKDDDVLQYNKITDTASFVKPEAYIVKPCKEFYHFKGNKGLDQKLSEEHKMLIWVGYKSKGYYLVDKLPKEIENFGNKLKKSYYGIKTSFNIENQSSINLTDDEIRLDIMISADGCIRRQDNGLNVVELHFSKSRKIERAKYLLESCNINYKMTLSTITNTTYFYFKIRKDINKDLSKYFKANKAQLEVVAKECLLWDGHTGYRSYYSSINKQNADVIQFAFASTNIRAGIYSKNSKKYKTCYCVSPTRNNIIGITNNITKVKSLDGKKYCFTVPDGYFVARRNNKIFITGNCGMSFQLYDYDVSQISKEQLQIIHAKISTEVNCRVRNSIPDKKFLPNKLVTHNISLEEIEASNYQLGTLGGGNHFIELQKTQANSLGIMIHSGSRNLGNIIARRYITKAQESMRQYYSKVPEDLAFLDLNSHAGREYYDCMRYCGLYAKKNRLYLLHIVDSVLDEVLKTNIKDKSMGFVDCTHNYAELYTIKSTLKGMVHRKGAISARKNELGIIPGSQGSTSYIVEGKGNKQSFQSCSHGAGRVLSRNEAKDKLNLNEQKALLDGQGIIHSMNNISDLDEAPGAYKSITEVLKSQEDLVEIILTLNPILNIKG